MNETFMCDMDSGKQNYVVIALYVPVALIALIANILVITVVVKFHYMRNITNYFLVNLSIADLLVTAVCMPNGVWSAYTMSWNFDKYSCKLRNYMQCISVASSVFTITAMALDRYIAINQPFTFGISTKRSTILIIAFMWTLPMFIFSPLLYVTELDSFLMPEPCIQAEYIICFENWTTIENHLPQHVFGTVSFLFMFAIPGLIILWAYAMMGKKLCSDRPPSDDNNFSTQQSFRIIRERKRVAWILLMLVAIFAICWLPYNTNRLLQDFGISDKTPDTYDQYSLLLGHLNSALNPIIYCAMSKNFRTSVRQILCRTPINFHNGKNRRLQVQWADSSGSMQRVCLQRMNTGPPIHVQLHMTLSRLQSSQKTTKTCAV